MREQPRLLESRAESLFEQARASLSKEKPQLIVFAARGSSDHACIYGKYLFEITLGIPVSLAAPSVITRYHADIKYPKSLLIGVSQSAAAPDVAEILAHAQSRGTPTLSITNAESGPVVDAADNRIFLGAGEEKAIAATKTFTLTLLALYQIARAMGAALPKPEIRKETEQALADNSIPEIAQAVTKSELLFALARGYQFPIALEAALKLMECALLPCKPFSFADFAHGPIALADDSTSVLAFGDDEDDSTSAAVRSKLSQAGASVMQVPNARALPEELRPIIAAIYAQRIAHEAALIRNIDPDSPRNLRKVTRTR